MGASARSDGVLSRVAGAVAEQAAAVDEPQPFATAYVFITTDGFTPEVLTVTVGTEVVWTNAMTEPVTLSGEGIEPNRVYLPLVLRGAAGAAAQTAAAPQMGPQAVDDVRGITLPPGGSASYVFTLADVYEYEAGGGLTGRSTVNVDPLQIDDPALAWATGVPGILLRWRWPRYDEGTNTLAAQPSGYNVYRNGAKLNTSPITYVTGTAFTTTMGADWTWFQSTFTDVTTVSGFHNYMDDNPLAQHWLADQRHRIALARGLGYLDETASPSVP